MSGWNLLQIAALESAKYKRVTEEAEDNRKREMYALEKRVAAGETLGPIEMSFLLSMQDRLGRTPSVPDPEIPEIALEPPPKMPPVPDGRYRYEPPGVISKALYVFLGGGIGASYIVFTRALGIDFSWYTDLSLAILATFVMARLGDGSHVVAEPGEGP